MASGGNYPEVVTNAVLKRVAVGKISRILKTRLAFAQFKVAHGLEDLPFDTIEPRMEELQGSENLSDASSEGDNSCTKTRCAVEVTNNEPLVCSSLHQLMQYNSGYRKRCRHHSFDDSDHHKFSWEKHYSSPPRHHLTPYPSRYHALSSPIMARKHRNFTTDSGPNLPLFANTCCKNGLDYRSAIELERDNQQPLFRVEFQSSPPHTPTCHRYYEHLIRPSPLSPSLPISTLTPLPPSTPPPQLPTLPSSLMSSTRGTFIFSGDGVSRTPSYGYDFSDFVNISPSPARLTWPVTPPKVRD